MTELPTRPGPPRGRRNTKDSGLSPSGGNALAGTPGTEIRADSSLARRRRRIRIPESAALVVFLGALLAFFSIKSDVFLTTDNLINVLISAAVIGILACPATMLLIAGQFDLSVGAGVALVSTTFAWELANGWSVPTAVLASILLGVGFGALNGFLVTVVGISALITTLGTLAIFRGLAFINTGGIPIQIDGFGTLGIGRPFLNLTWSVVIFLLTITLAGLVLRSTVYGRSLYAIGANAVAARLAGIRVRRTIFVTFLLSGFAVAIGGLIIASSTGQGSGNAATGTELVVVTAVILGGASLSGGRGSIIGTTLGVLILGIIANGLTLMNVESFWQDVVSGTLLIVAVGFDVLRRRLTRG